MVAKLGAAQAALDTAEIDLRRTGANSSTTGPRRAARLRAGAHPRRGAALRRRGGRRRAAARRREPLAPVRADRARTARRRDPARERRRRRHLRERRAGRGDLRARQRRARHRALRRRPRRRPRAHRREGAPAVRGLAGRAVQRLAVRRRRHLRRHRDGHRPVGERGRPLPDPRSSRTRTTSIPGPTSTSCASAPSPAAGCSWRRCRWATRSGASSTTSRRSSCSVPRWPTTARSRRLRALLLVICRGGDRFRGPRAQSTSCRGRRRARAACRTRCSTPRRRTSRRSSRPWRSAAAAEGDVLASQGAFDLVFSADGLGWAVRLLRRPRLRGPASRRFRTFGAEVYGGYQISRGDFPIYQDDPSPPTARGKAKVGVIFKRLLRDRVHRRAALRRARRAHGARRRGSRVCCSPASGVQQQALTAYWRWVKAGHQLAVYENLVAIAQENPGGLRRRSSQRARASIFLTENRQNILRRQTLAQAARGTSASRRTTSASICATRRARRRCRRRSACRRCATLQVHVEPRVLGDLPLAALDSAGAARAAQRLRRAPTTASPSPRTPCSPRSS